jgi:uncharacterized surface protein with fasciclin (FAS1) repeats
MNSNQNKNVKMWVMVVVAVVVVGGLWWWSTNGAAMPTTPTITGSETSGAGAVTIQTSTAASVAAVLSSIPNSTRFNQLLAQTGVAATLNGKGPFTVFVATDGAYGRLVPGTINNMSSAELKRTMQYSIVSGKTLDVDAISSGQVQALSGDALNFVVDATKGAVYVNSGYVLSAYKVKNGIVYVINQVLLPPKKSTI